MVDFKDMLLKLAIFKNILSDQMLWLLSTSWQHKAATSPQPYTCKYRDFLQHIIIMYIE